MRTKPEDRRWQVRLIRRDDGLWYAEVEGQVERGGLRDLCLHDLTMAYARKAAAIREVRRLVHAWLKMQRRTWPDMQRKIQEAGHGNG